MLIQISCDKLVEKNIFFHKGLNPVIGDNIASNSIGKSIMLMIIDFVFGGNDYINKNRDVIENVGEHKFYFIFEFSGEKYFFSRSTTKYSDIGICSEKLIETNYITLSAYTELLQKKYDCVLEDTSFRDIVGRFFRIYGKENLNEKKPIQYFDKESYQRSLLYLMKLFNKYIDIKHLDEEVTREENRKNVMTFAMDMAFIPRVNKLEYTANKNAITDLEEKIEKLKAEAVRSTIDAKAIISDEVIFLKEEKSSLVIKHNMLKNRLKRINANIESRSGSLEKELTKLKEFFPDLNIARIKEVEDFHRSLTSNLNKEFKKARTEIEAEIRQLEDGIHRVDKEIENKLSVKDISSIAVDSLIELSRKVNAYQEVNRYYEESIKIKSNISELSSSLKELKSRILSDIMNSINRKMAEIHASIYPDDRRPPILTLTPYNYRFDTFYDTGTGTAFANLITFDLAVLNLTKLPALAHDLPLLKNIENFAFSNIVNLYTQSHKQIFIAIDKLNSYDERTEKNLRKLAVLELSKDRLLFKKNWKRIDKS